MFHVKHVMICVSRETYYEFVFHVKHQIVYELRAMFHVKHSMLQAGQISNAQKQSLKLPQ